MDMRSFFESMYPWERNDGALHLYVVPDEELGDRLVAQQSRLEGIENLPLMPRPWLHFTVNRLAQFDDLGQRELSRLAAALTEELESVPAFELDLGTPQVHDVAVEVVAEKVPGWEALVDAVRKAALDTFGGTMPKSPYAPHVSLAYATGDVSDDLLHQRLAGVEPAGRFRVDSVRLMSVTVRPEVGIFDFVELAGWPLRA